MQQPVSKFQISRLYKSYAGSMHAENLNLQSGSYFVVTKQYIVANEQ